MALTLRSYFQTRDEARKEAKKLKLKNATIKVCRNGAWMLAYVDTPSNYEKVDNNEQQQRS